MPDKTPQRSSGTATTTRDEVARPPMYRVLLHNDNYTTMEFVILVLRRVFHKRQADAVRIMLNVHEQGVGQCGVYIADIAETKVKRVHTMARDNGYPLRCSMEPE